MRRFQLILLLLLGAASGVASVASACVPQPLLFLEPRASGAPGSPMTARGVTFGPAPVEIRWNGIEGPVLGTATGPDFSISVTVPDVVEGLYSIVGIARSPSGGVAATGSVSFEVISQDVGRADPAKGPTALNRSQTSTSVGGPPPSPARPASRGLSLLPLAAGGAVLLGLGAVAGRVSVGTRHRREGDLATESAGTTQRTGEGGA